MVKRILAAVMAYMLVGGVLCGVAASAYVATPAQNSCVAGKVVYFSVDYPPEAVKVVPVIDGKETSTPVFKTAEGEGGWIYLKFTQPGTAKVQFAAYDAQDNEYLRFPDTPIQVEVESPPPVTGKAYVAEHDMATLSATIPAEYMGSAKASEYGFYWGESPDELTHKVKGNKPYNHVYNKLITKLEPGTTYYFRAYMKTAQGEQQGKVRSFTTLEQQTWTAQDAIFDTPEERYAFLFDDVSRCPTIENPPKGYNGRAEAMEHIVEIEVPVWRMTSGNGRRAGTATLSINRKLAPNIQAIFQEIYELDIQFPMHYVRGMNYRRINGLRIFQGTTFLSHHSFGTAIDINYDENLFYPPGRDGRNKKNPYTIPQEVIDVFEKYGWSWGGYFLEGIDAMHFQYLGLDLMTQVDYVTPPKAPPPDDTQ